MNNKNNNNVNTDTQQNRVDQSRNEIFRFSRISLEIDFAALLPGRAVLATRCRFQSAHRDARFTVARPNTDDATRSDQCLIWPAAVGSQARRRSNRNSAETSRLVVGTFWRLPLISESKRTGDKRQQKSHADHQHCIYESYHLTAISTEFGSNLGQDCVLLLTIHGKLSDTWRLWKDISWSVESCDFRPICRYISTVDTRQGRQI